MSTEPTSVQTFDDLILEVADYLAVSYYGAAGDEAAQIPVDVVDLARCKRHVNNGIRMLISNAPAAGWRWAKPTAGVVLWPSVALDDDVTATGVYVDPITTITASEATFYPSMEGKTIVVTGSGSYTIVTYTSSTVITITGDHAFAGKTFSIAANGDYQLPRTFGGEHGGVISYAADTNSGVNIEWNSESFIHQLRASSVAVSGFPSVAAVSKSSTERRWGLMVYPSPTEVATVVFPYDLSFDELTTGTELHPAGHSFDEVVKAACLAVAEKAVEGSLGGPNWTYYRDTALPDAHRINARTAPKRLGSMDRPRRLVTLEDIRRASTVDTTNI